MNHQFGGLVAGITTVVALCAAAYAEMLAWNDALFMIVVATLGGVTIFFIDRFVDRPPTNNASPCGDPNTSQGRNPMAHGVGESRNFTSTEKEGHVDSFLKAFLPYMTEEVIPQRQRQVANGDLGTMIADPFRDLFLKKLNAALDPLGVSTTIVRDGNALVMVITYHEDDTVLPGRLASAS